MALPFPRLYTARADVRDEALKKQAPRRFVDFQHSAFADLFGVGSVSRLRWREIETQEHADQLWAEHPLRELTPDELAEEFDAAEKQMRDTAMTAHPHCDDPAHPGCSRCRGDDGWGRRERSVTYESVHGRQLAEKEMWLRDYFIAHAPAEPQPWFMPKVETTAPVPPAYMTNQTPEERREMQGWGEYLGTSDLEQPRVRAYAEAKEAFDKSSRAYRPTCRRFRTSPTRRTPEPISDSERLQAEESDWPTDWPTTRRFSRSLYGNDAAYPEAPEYADPVQRFDNTPFGTFLYGVVLFAALIGIGVLLAYRG